LDIGLHHRDALKGVKSQGRIGSRIIHKENSLAGKSFDGESPIGGGFGYHRYGYSRYGNRGYGLIGIIVLVVLLYWLFGAGGLGGFHSS
jgi:hypothetical protein